MRPIIGKLIDDNYARQIRLPRTLPDFRTTTMQKVGSKLAQRVIERRAWLAEQQRKPGKVLRFGGAAKS